MEVALCVYVGARNPERKRYSRGINLKRQGDRRCKPREEIDVWAQGILYTYTLWLCLVQKNHHYVFVCKSLDSHDGLFESDRTVLEPFPSGNS